MVVMLGVGNRAVDEGAGCQISLPGGSAGKESVCISKEDIHPVLTQKEPETQLQIVKP